MLYDKHGLNIAPDTLRRQLALMYAAGWYPVNMRDVLTARIRVPRGRIPVVLTFDDARPSQFRYLPNGRIDPSSAVGILEAFHRRHRDWPRRATFYVLPESRWNGVPFEQDGAERRKLRYLLRRGYEIANHTLSHRSLATMSPATLRWEMAEAVRDIRRLAPRATMDTMALPYGIAPNDPTRWDLLLDGRQGGTRYHNRCILLASGGPAFPFAHRQFDRRQVPRIEPEPGAIERWITDLRPGGPVAPFVSDGKASIVTIPGEEKKNLNVRRLRGCGLVIDFAYKRGASSAAPHGNAAAGVMRTAHPAAGYPATPKGL
ncbi:MAG TPA: polysaccharide deacetylase family protein [Chthonomonadaceae bacterium]|nr:polysaccharide deacetylase family protein [Chthonomonadaceae bacterium]